MNDNNFLNNLVKLLEAINKYVDETKAHKLNWKIISTTLEWNAIECQKIWRYLSYHWDPFLTTTNYNQMLKDIQQITTTMTNQQNEEEESDLEDEKVVFRLKKLKETHQKIMKPPENQVNASILQKPMSTISNVNNVNEDDEENEDEENDTNPEQNKAKETKRTRKEWTAKEDQILVSLVIQNPIGVDWNKIRKLADFQGRNSNQLASRFAKLCKQFDRKILKDSTTFQLLEQYHKTNQQLQSQSKQP